MMKRLALYFLLLSLSVGLSAEYIRPPTVSEELWEELKPYFLPEDSPLKEKLDKIFVNRPTRSLKGLKLAQFKIPVLRKRTKVVLAKHSKLKGVLLKLYTDDVPYPNEWFDWRRRIIGARYISQLVSEMGYEHLFKVPQKWIYPLPQEPEGLTPGPYRKDFVLIVEDMKILSPEKNQAWWRSVAMTEERVKAIYTIFQRAGLADSVYPENLPFAKDRKMAFVDTQYYTIWPINFIKLLPYFSIEMQGYWLTLIQNGG